MLNADDNLTKTTSEQELPTKPYICRKYENIFGNKYNACYKDSLYILSYAVPNFTHQFFYFNIGFKNIFMPKKQEQFYSLV